MSKYNTEVRFICEEANGILESKGYSSVNTIISNAIPKIFDFTFPIFDSSYRNVLCGKILKHYYTQEIGFETVALWKLKLDTKLNEIMPYYNKLYESELLKFNPLYDVDLTTDHKGTGTKHETFDGVENHEKEANTEQGKEQTTENVNWDLYSDTPQNGLSDVEDMEYLTNARKVTDNGSLDETINTGYTEGNTRTTDNEGNVQTTDDYITKVFGKSGGVSYSKMLKEFRETFLNIDMMVIRELKNLFMEVW